jgi:hypothetical protein
MAVYPSGNIRFITSFRNRGDGLNCKYAISCFTGDAVPHAPAHVWQVSRGGVLGGGIVGPPREQNGDATTNDPLLRDNWANLVTGHQDAICTVKTGWSLGDLINEVVKDINEYGPIIGTIISIIS